MSSILGPNSYASAGNRGFGNQIIRSLGASLFAEKFNLFINYPLYDEIKKLHIDLFIGTQRYNITKELTDNNYFDYLKEENIDFNITTNSYFQTNDITNHIHKYLHSEKIMNKIMNNSEYKNRYNNNNDCFIHIRLGDVSNFNPGFEYYDNIISKISFSNLYIATDTQNHEIINKLKNKYSDLKIYDTTLTDIILFGSSCKYVVLSYGTFSAIIGYLAFYSHVYYLKYREKYAWGSPPSCDIFRNKYSKISSWIEN